MSKTLNNVIKEHFVKNMSLYVIVILAFTIGICTGAFTVNALNYTQYNELTDYVNDFFHIINGEDVNNIELLRLSVFNHIKMVSLLWILGITVVGIPFILVIIGIKGFVIGFTVGFMAKTLSMKGVFFAILAILPQNLIIVPGYIALGIICISFSLSMVRSKMKTRYKKDDTKMRFITYSTYILLAFFFLTIGSIIEAYITPVFIQLISSTLIV